MDRARTMDEAAQGKMVDMEGVVAGEKEKREKSFPAPDGPIFHLAIVLPQLMQ
jgi:hypothetical protein